VEAKIEESVRSASEVREQRTPWVREMRAAGMTTAQTQGSDSGPEVSGRAAAKRQASFLRSGEYDYDRPRRGDIREGVILSVGEHDLVVDIGAKRDAIVPPRDVELLDEEYRAGLREGDCVPVVITRGAGRRGGLLASIEKGLKQSDWLRARELLESGEVVEEEVNEVNRGGVVAAFGRLRGFVPNSHLTSVPRGLRGDRLRQAKSDLVGKTLHVVVIEVDQRRRHLVLSEPLANERRAAELLRDLNEGDIRVGTVANIVDFGAFVDLGGVDGLIHISELDWTHVEHPSDVVAVGDEIEVYVLSVDRERKRVGLSRKRLLPDPWHAVTDALHSGKLVDGKVTGVVSFGFFVDVGSGVEGLVHASDMLGTHTRLSDIEPGSEVTVRVLSIDEWKRRISLRLEDNGKAAGHEDAPSHRPIPSIRSEVWSHT
jgi:small subunit ribosomal protein S1